MQFLLLASAMLFLLAEPSHAYLDPGTGSLILQMIVAGALTAWASIRMFWSRIKEFFQRLSGAKSPSNDGQ
ncbi:MAG: hypothetical protein SF069_11175 [Phycisphaerae bacterium]|nr:hypothetical protein [Phycisphaerae bacterium]